MIAKERSEVKITMLNPETSREVNFASLKRQRAFYSARYPVSNLTSIAILSLNGIVTILGQMSLVIFFQI